MILRAEIDHGDRSYDHYSWLALTYKTKVIGLTFLYLAFLVLIIWLQASADKLFGAFTSLSVFCIVGVHDRYQRLKEVQLLSHQAAADEGHRAQKAACPKVGVGLERLHEQ